MLPSFNEGRFPFCKVLEEGKMTFYWSHDHKKEGKWTGVEDGSSPACWTFVRGRGMDPEGNALPPLSTSHS